MPIGRALRTLTTGVDLAVFLWRRYHSAAQGPALAADSHHDVPLERKPAVAAATGAGDPSPEFTQTVRFGFDGQNYAIELGDESAAEMRDVLNRYIAAGRPVGRNARTANVAPGRRRSERQGTANGNEASEIRKWARAHGHRITDQGPIPAAVRQAYDNRRRGHDGH